MSLPTNINEREWGKFTEDADGNISMRASVGNETSYSWSNILTQAEFNIKESAGYLKGIVINTPLASGVISVFNNGSGASVPIATITQPGTLLSDTTTRVDYDLAFDSGLTIVTSGANQDITVIYK